MEFMDILQGRHSVREYSDARVPMEMIDRLLECVKYVPSACNRRGWLFKAAGRSERLSRMAPHAKLSPVSLFVFYRREGRNKEFNDDYQSAAAAIMTVIYRAHELGLSTCWVCHISDRKGVERLLGAPKGYRLVAQVNLGYGEVKA